MLLRPCLRLAPSWAALASVCLAFLLMGCGPSSKEPDARTAAKELREAFPETGTVSDAVRVAIAASESKDYASGVLALETAKVAPGLSADQLATMERARQGLTAELVRRADAGDPKAREQLATIERARSQ